MLPDRGYQTRPEGLCRHQLCFTPGKTGERISALGNSPEQELFGQWNISLNFSLQSCKLQISVKPGVILSWRSFQNCCLLAELAASLQGRGCRQHCGGMSCRAAQHQPMVLRAFVVVKKKKWKAFCVTWKALNVRSATQKNSFVSV